MRFDHRSKGSGFLSLYSLLSLKIFQKFGSSGPSINIDRVPSGTGSLGDTGRSPSIDKPSAFISSSKATLFIFPKG